ncbi:DUF3618 domain-containing protein [Actinospica durhamensis]|uniref:DUF3618 domain-containing protein n=1 Tax=Actinospica durhamensis TaxID=1508375 RepID=A0A941ITM2_9ACTN|nr:DUF3618 domain-containing protein [Actinospica durhamensis]MBR7834491.1 DUF3618 domain-containing protein [Actinospica durhamensis]
MSTKKRSWTEPGPIDYETHTAADTRMGTAASNPVLSLAPRPATPAGRGATAGNRSHGSERTPDHRSPAQIEADIEQTRDRLAVTLDELTDRLTPRALLRQTNAKARAAFVAANGRVRVEQAALLAGTAASAVFAVVALRLSRRR